MANEATLMVRTGEPIPMTVADASAIEKGSIMMLSDPNTCALSTGDNDYVAGILSSEKIANSGTTNVGVFREGIFEILCSGAVTAGQAVMTFSSTGGYNYVTLATANSSGGRTLGIALETTAAGTSERILVELKPGCNNN